MPVHIPQSKYLMCDDSDNRGILSGGGVRFPGVTDLTQLGEVFFFFFKDTKS